jgi:hypothetical protein
LENFERFSRRVVRIGGIPAGRLAKRIKYESRVQNNIQIRKAGGDNSEPSLRFR